MESAGRKDRIKIVDFMRAARLAEKEAMVLRESGRANKERN